MATTNRELLATVARCHGAAAAELQRAAEVVTGEELLASITRLRNQLRGAHCAAQELKNRLKARVAPKPNDEGRTANVTR